MTLVYRNAESKLLDRLQSLGNDRQRWRLAIFPASELHPSSRRLLKDGDSLHKLALSAQECALGVYCCEDGDICFIFADLTRHQLPTMQKMVLSLLPHLSPEGIDFESAFAFYDLGISMDAIIRLLRGKLHLQAARKTLAATTAPELATAAPPSEAEPEEKALAPYRRNLQHRLPGHKPLVMVIDDDEAVRELARSLLLTHYAVLTANDGPSGLSALANYLPDLIFLDIQMPGMNGLEVLQHIRQDLPHIPVVMFSARSTQENIHTAINLGARGFITKPFTAQLLMDRAIKTLAMN